MITNENSMDILVKQIGTVDVDDGRDEYVLLTRKDDDITAEQAMNWLLPRVYRQSYRAGQYYCTYVRTLVEGDVPTNKVVCIIEHRYDI